MKRDEAVLATETAHIFMTMTLLSFYQDLQKVELDTVTFKYKVP